MGVADLALIREPEVWLLLVWWRQHAAQPSPELAAKSLAARSRHNSSWVGADYPVQFGSGDWITVITRATGTFTGEMTLPDDTVIAPTGKAFDIELGQTSQWDGDQLIVISAFWDSTRQAQQLGLA